MHQGRSVFSQVMDYFPERDFQSIVERHEGNKWVQSFTCRSHFNVMAFAQLTGRESLRDIETCLAANTRHLHHMGIQSGVSRNNLAHANETRDWRIYRDVALLLIGRARQLYAGELLDVDLNNAVYAFDSTTVELCLTLFPWAVFRKAKAGIKMHTSVDVRGSIPSFIRITDAKQHDVNALDEIPFEPGAYYLIDRGHLDFGRLYGLGTCGSFFVTRAKKNTLFRRLYSSPVDKALGLRSDQRGVLCGVKARNQYPAHIRRVTYRDPKTDKHLCFLTNSLAIPAIDVCKLYKMRWQVELFFACQTKPRSVPEGNARPPASSQCCTGYWLAGWIIGPGPTFFRPAALTRPVLRPAQAVSGAAAVSAMRNTRTRNSAFQSHRAQRLTTISVFES